MVEYELQSLKAILNKVGEWGMIKALIGEGGGIGRRAGLRIQWGDPWGFNSPLRIFFI